MRVNRVPVKLKIGLNCIFQSTGNINIRPMHTEYNHYIFRAAPLSYIFTTQLEASDWLNSQAVFSYYSSLGKEYSSSKYVYK